MNTLTEILLLAPPILFAVTIHEFSHGYVADRLGDPTARLAGRLTLNPLAHLDLLGTLMFFLIRIGWAKPVPVDPRNLSNPKSDMFWISAAGPGSNMLAALGLGLIVRYAGVNPLHVLQGIGPSLTVVVIQFIVVYGIIINLVLAGFNLIPLPPLDGSKILMGVLPPAQAYKFSQLERYGPLILMGLLMAGWVLHIPILTLWIGPFVNFFMYLFTGYSMKVF